MNMYTTISIRTYTLKTIRQNLHHQRKRIDVLKLDVGEIEVDIIDKMLHSSTSTPMLPRVLIVDFDSMGYQKPRMTQTFANILKAGYALHHAAGTDFTFVLPH